MNRSRDLAFERHLGDSDDRQWDVVVIGAGPAGATAAAHLASNGHAVLILDRHPFPREKVCGDALIPDALHALRTLGLLETVLREGNSVDHLAVLSPSGIRVKIPAKCVTLRREVLDALILTRAIASGATFRVAAVDRLLQRAGGGVVVSVKNSEVTVHARIAILATGADVSLLGKLGMVERPAPSALALRCYAESSLEINELIVSFDRSVIPGYAWIFPMGKRQYNMGCGVFYGERRRRTMNLRDAFTRFVTKAKIARDLLQQGQLLTRLRGARIRAGLAGTEIYSGASILSIGEAIGATYPFTGEGIGKAMETGVLAAGQIHRALDKGDSAPLRELSGLIERELAPRYVGYRTAQRWLARPWLLDLLAARLRYSTALREAAGGILDETTNPQKVFSWLTLLPTWRRPPSSEYRL
ncbi:MAG: hypothetical protein AMS18_01835 [Gemmatimonas sp. SG8_17]|nr:MAG: hypothetical protein AMS18_01835 [Gemmatimonas sp. SG8_17]